ncbi:YchJ family protein [Brachybacterium sp. AOP25-B2-12]|uniref:YchJ family protein n=1 Tax=Brachybacterium sp. AOP25-B2-12 TaxID=3457710 RepID=UPI004033E739
MRSPDPDTPCPCGSGDRFAVCCGPILAGRPAPTAVQLMRSRFTAYAVGNDAHVLRTWHPSTRPSAADLARSRHEVPVWRRLVVHRQEQGGPFDDHGIVEFTALARDADGASLRLHETSRFDREDGTWTYVDGDVTP